MKLTLSESSLPVTDHPSAESRDAGRPRERTENASFDLYFQQYWPRIYALLEHMLGDPAEAQDVALEAFYRLHENGPRLDPGSNIAGWLHRVATNLGLHAIRSMRRRSSYEEAAVMESLGTNAGKSPIEIVADRERRRLVRSALAQMNSRQSQLLVLRYSGLSYKEIAAALELSPASIGPLLLRAEREFEKRYRALAQEES